MRASGLSERTRLAHNSPGQADLKVDDPRDEWGKVNTGALGKPLLAPTGETEAAKVAHIEEGVP